MINNPTLISLIELIYRNTEDLIFEEKSYEIDQEKQLVVVYTLNPRTSNRANASWYAFDRRLSSSPDHP